MADTYTQAELEAMHPDGTVNVQTDDDVRPMTTDQWQAWIASQVGTPKLADDEVPTE